MGNWRNRPRRYFKRRDRSAGDDYYDDPPEPQDSAAYWGSVDDGVPMWEKKFCSEVGLVPWRKVVDSKMFMYSHASVLNWDDSASKEAFHDAKSRYWAEINNLPCDISRPDPDLHIDEIDWNANIDPELLKDIEQSFFIPEEDEMDNNARRRNKRLRYLMSNHSERYKGNAGSDSRDLWEFRKDDPLTSVTPKDRAQEWNQWDSNKAKSNKLNKDDNPSEPATTPAGEANGWSIIAGVMPSEWKQSGGQWNSGKNSGNAANPWERGWQDIDPVKDDGWGKCADGSWDQKWQQPEKMNNSGKSWGNNVQGWQNDDYNNKWRAAQWHNNGKEHRSVKATEASDGWGVWNSSCQAEKSNNGYSCWEGSAARGWRHNKDNAWDHNPWSNNVNYEKSMESREVNAGWGEWSAGRRNNKDDDAYRTDYRHTVYNKSTRFQGTRNQTDRSWRDAYRTDYRHTAYNKSTRFQGTRNQTDRSWRDGNTKKRVSFAFE